MKISKLFLILITATLFTACNQNTDQHVMIETEFGNMKAVLYNSTPQHRDNFVKLANEGFYNDLLFHRVMKNFMVQGGDPKSKDSPAGQPLGSGGPGYTVPAEFGAHHFKGALAAARQPDSVNPQKNSSGSQFYIVHGTQVNQSMLDRFSQKENVSYSPEQAQRYLEQGGYPPLDGEYTVFGEVVEGLDVIDKIAANQVDARNRPLEDIKMKVYTVK